MNTYDFMKNDFNFTLFPIKTNLLIAQYCSEDLSKFVSEKVSTGKECFQSQQRVYATKTNGHLRRTVKLDPIAEHFIYDIIYKNRRSFRGSVSDKRKSFGYIFKDGIPISVHDAFENYKNDIFWADITYKHKIKFDIASYFNSVYQHDLAYWFSGLNGVSSIDKKSFSQFFREINTGRSIDALPQGIYPSKMIGNEFLKFIDLHKQLKSTLLIRFMDDFILYDNDLDVVTRDFIKIQEILGEYGLNINPGKTLFDRDFSDVNDELQEIKKSLKEIFVDIQPVYSASSFEYGMEVEVEREKKLNESQIKDLISLLKRESLDESEADMILGFMHSHSDSIIEYIPDLVKKFPNIIKHIYAICSKITDKNGLAKTLLELLNKNQYFLEYQLFWLACIAEDFLHATDLYGDLLIKIYELSAEFRIARAKVLEIPIKDFGFKEIRKNYLQSGQSDWLSWSSAIGTRSYPPDERNYVLGYFSKCSPMNSLISKCVKKIEI